MDQFKTSDDLEVYEFDYRDNHHLQEACDVRQPMLFYLDDVAPKFFQDLSLEKMAKFGSHDVSLKNVADYYKKEGSLDPLPLPFYQTLRIIETDKESRFFSENNKDFLDETGLYKSFQYLDDFVKPSFLLYSKYDLTTGSIQTVTPLRFHKYYRHFMCVVSGKIHIRLAPWKNTKYLHYSKADYEYYEFRSPVHSIRPEPEHSTDFDKVNFLHFDVVAGQTLYIPPYWWYSIEYLEPNTFVGCVYHSTWMNSVANLPDLALYWLQQQNITKKVKPTTDLPSVPLESKTDEGDVLLKEEDSVDDSTVKPIDPSIEPSMDDNVLETKEKNGQEQEQEQEQEKPASDPISIVIQEVDSGPQTTTDTDA